MAKNLDAALNELSYKIFEEIKNNKDKTKFANLCDKALWVLVNDGPYAFVLFINSKNAQDVYLKPIFEDENFKQIFWFNSLNYIEEIQNLSENLHDYLYFKTLLEKLLIYVRYHLKTLDQKKWLKR